MDPHLSISQSNFLEDTFLLSSQPLSLDLQDDPKAIFFLGPLGCSHSGIRCGNSLEMGRGARCLLIPNSSPRLFPCSQIGLFSKLLSLEFPLFLETAPLEHFLPFPTPFRIYLVANGAIPAKGVPYFVPFWDLWAGRDGIWEQTVNPCFTIPIFPV